jgi:large subunit ribosomal protein L13
MLEKHPTQIIEHAVRGMMPKTVLGDAMFKKLKVYAGTEHPHAAQKPVELNLKEK